MFCFVLLFVLSFPEMCFRRLLCVFVSAGLSFNFEFWVFLLAWVFLSWISGFLFSSFVFLFPLVGGLWPQRRNP